MFGHNTKVNLELNREVEKLIKIGGKHDNALTRIIAAPGLWAQRITTKEPDDKMIEVAIEAIKAVIPEDGSDIVSK